jgi:hypothetical protein
VATLRAKPTRPASQNRAPAQTPAAKSRPLAQPRSPDTATKLADAAAPVVDSATAADSQVAAAGEPAEPATGLAAGTTAAADSAGDQKVRQDSAAEELKQKDDGAVRGAASAALAELDRERRRERANAATAALPPVRPVQPESDAVAAAPRTLEQRAQIFLRVGLDEAAKQLGGPVHVIEGMTPQFIGLTRGQLVAGADPARPVVRVVYLDSRGRMILLDQQRTRAGQTPNAAGSLRWVTGDVMLYLRGEPSPEVLRSLQGRVR